MCGVFHVLIVHSFMLVESGVLLIVVCCVFAISVSALSAVREQDSDAY
jgi:hypothetical protein